MPQGSFLGPILFSIYIYDIINSSKQAKGTLFADETCLCFEAGEKENLELDLLLFQTVNEKKMLAFNITNIELNVKLNNLSLIYNDHAKYLGVITNRRLNWKE